MKRFIVLLMAVLPTLALAQDRPTLERRVQSVGTLIESSSAARQIDSSGVPAARERRELDLRHRAELLESEARFAQLVGSALDAIVTVEADGTVSIDGALTRFVDRVGGAAPDRAFLADLQMNNAAALDRLRDNYPAQHDRVKAAIAARLAALDEAEGGEE